ncbi:MAG: ATP-binding protein [Deltaproteobacteria bacterium]|nr:ATP-binding protein [Deltaproteobacteria bacterium]
MTLTRRAPSLRRRFIALAVVASLASLTALVAMWFLANTGEDQRIERAQTQLARALDAPHRARNARHGVVDAQGQTIAGPPVPAFVMQSLAQCASDQPVFIQRDREGVLVIAALRANPDGSCAWAASPSLRPGTRRWMRAVVLALALLAAASVAYALRTASLVQAGVSQLDLGITALERDLSARIEPPALDELQRIAARIASLAAALDTAQREQRALATALEQRERLAALGRVTAGVAHEVRNPLASMKLRVDLAQRSRDTPAALREELAEVSQEISRLDRLVSDLLVLSGRRAPERQARALGELVAQRCQAMRPWSDARGVTLTCEGSATVALDADSLARAVDNLVRNAIEASPPQGTVHVSVQATRDGAMVTVSDSGAGIAHEHARKVFEPFFTTRPDGTGLGLALAHAVAKAHGGTITHQRKGDRTVFVLTLSNSKPTDQPTDHNQRPSP